MDEGERMSIATAIGPDGKEYPTGDLEPLLSCSRCGQLRPLSEYHISTTGPAERLGRAYTCKACKAALGKALREQPKPSRQRRVIERRELVLGMLKEHLSISEIVERLGSARSTIDNDVKALRAEGLLAPPDGALRGQHQPNVVIADNVLRQLDDLVGLVHDGRRIVLQLEGLPLTPEMSKEWEKRLRHVGQALRYLRSHARKGTT